MTKIKLVEIYKLNVAWTQPLKIAIGVVDAARNVAIKIVTGSGHVGWGEASPMSCITGDSQDTNYQTAQALAGLVIGRDAIAIEDRMSEINRFTVAEPSIRSAFDMALYDIASQFACMPLYAFLGGSKKSLRTDMTISCKDSVAETLDAAGAILAAGFHAVKMKTGRSGLEDVQHVGAVRDLVGPHMAIRIDCNQGWDVPSAIANIRAMAAFNVEYVEQPLKHWDHHGLAVLRSKVDLPICVDESVFDHFDALKLITAGCADFLNIKLGKAGGIHTSLKINAIAEAAGKKCMIGSFGESRLGLTAAAHLAAARPNIAYLDLDSAYAFKEDPVKGGMLYDEASGGLINLPDSPGLGAEFREEMLDQQSKILIH